MQAAVVGAACEDVDAAAREVIAAAGLGELFIHRTGHGIGVEAHEDPYVVAGNSTPLAPGHAFSIEPGIYLPGRFGLRLEDIVVATDAGPERLNDAPRDLAVVGVKRRAARSRDGPGAARGGRAARLLGDDPASRGRASATAGLLRITYVALARSAAVAGFLQDDSGTGATIRDVGAVGIVVAAARRARVVDRATRRGRARAPRAARRDGKRRVAAMLAPATGRDEPRDAGEPPARSSTPRSTCWRRSPAWSRCSAPPPLVGGPYVLSRGPPRRRRAVPRDGHGRDAARPLVPRAAGPRTVARSSSSCAGRVALAVRGRGVPLAPGHGAGARRHDRRRLRRDPRVDVGAVARSRRSGSSA